MPAAFLVALFRYSIAFLMIVAASVAHADNASFKKGEAAYAAGDFSDAVKIWRPLADKGDAQAQYAMGLLARRGLGVPRDPVAAAEWWRKAANQGHTTAQFNLGVLYEGGEGVRKSYDEAFKWYRLRPRSAAIPTPSSISDLFYAAGRGTKRDLTAAVEWYRKAAEQGDAAAQYTLGFAYAAGMGVIEDRARRSDGSRNRLRRGFSPRGTRWRSSGPNPREISHERQGVPGGERRSRAIRFPVRTPVRHRPAGRFLGTARSRGLDAKVGILGSREATRDELERFHTVDYVNRVIVKSQQGVGYLDYGDTPAFVGVFEISSHVVGAALTAPRRGDGGDLQTLVPADRRAAPCASRARGWLLRIQRHRRRDRSAARKVRRETHCVRGHRRASRRRSLLSLRKRPRRDRSRTSTRTGIFYPGTGHAGETGKVPPRAPSSTSRCPLVPETPRF